MGLTIFNNFTQIFKNEQEKSNLLKHASPVYNKLQFFKMPLAAQVLT